MASAAAAKADWQTPSSNPAEVSASQISESERTLQQLAANFLSQSTARPSEGDLASSGETIPLSEVALSAASLLAAASSSANASDPLLNLETRYRVLVEQIPAVVFMAYLDGGIGEAYVSPQIESALGFSQREWLEDPVRWYQQIHPDDKMRWSVEAAEMFVSGKPLRSAYRVLARDGRVL